jgi:DNA-binding Lrp family transcriptional regulator
MSYVPDPLVSARERGGRRFQPVHEQSLERVALEACASLPNAQGRLIVIKELAGPYGIPDLVAVIGNQQAARDRLALSVPPLLNELDAAIVATAAPRAPRSTATLARRLGWDAQTVLSRMPRLLEIGALSETGPGVVVRAAALEPIGRLYAIETKLANWRRAVRQGRNYQLWCDTYVVVMEALNVAPLEGLLAAAREDGAGVVIGGRWRARAQVRGRSDWRRFWGSEYVVASIGHGSIPLIGTVSEQAI